MELSTRFWAFVLLVAFNASYVSAECCETKFTSLEHHQSILQNYNSMWNGDASQVNATFLPEFVVNADRFPSPTGVGSVPTTIRNIPEILGYVERSRPGWDKYNIEVVRWTSSDYHIAIRWRLDGVIGADFSLLPT
jgi:hypothetical protein